MFWKKENKKEEETFKEFSRMLEGVKIKQTTHDIILEDIMSKIKSFEIRYGKLFKLLKEEDLELNSEKSKKSNYLSDLTNGRNNPLGLY